LDIQIPKVLGHNSMKQTSDEGIFKFCGFEVIKHTFFGAVPHADDSTRQGYLKEVESIIKESL
jgi:NAD(P)H dehydrogenase (quinone)